MSGVKLSSDGLPGPVTEDQRTSRGEAQPTFRETWERKARWNGFGRPRIWLSDFNRDDEDESDVTVAYTFSGGSDDTYDASRGGPGGWDPGYPPEIEIYAAFGFADEVTLTEAEELRFGQWLMENPPEEDEPDYRNGDR